MPACSLRACGVLQQFPTQPTTPPPTCPRAGDEEARSRGTQKSVLERKAPPTFPLVRLVMF